MMFKISKLNSLLLAFVGTAIGLSSLSAVNPVAAQSTVAQAKVNQSANDLRAYEPSVADLPLSFKSSNSIALSTKVIPNPANAPKPSNIPAIAQSGTSTSSSPDILRNQLLIRPIDEQTKNVFVRRVYTPSLNAGTPVAFGLETGDAFIGLYGATAGRIRDTFDGSISIGAGLGDAREYFGVEGVYNINSIRRFAENGSFDLKVHRSVYEDYDKQVAVAVGWTNFANYGSDSGGTRSSVYGAVTYSQLTDPESLENPKPLIATLGVGGGVYRKSTSSDGVGVFANLGYQFDPQWGISTAWTGQGLNFGLGFLPDTTLPLNITLTYSDVTNSSDAGTQIILGITYGTNFTGRR